MDACSLHAVCTVHALFITANIRQFVANPCRYINTYTVTMMQLLYETT